MQLPVTILRALLLPEERQPLCQTKQAAGGGISGEHQEEGVGGPGGRL